MPLSEPMLTRFTDAYMRHFAIWFKLSAIHLRSRPPLLCAKTNESYNNIWNRIYLVKWRPIQNGQLIAKDIFKLIFLHGNIRIVIQISLKFVTECLTENIPLSEARCPSLLIYIHVCLTNLDLFPHKCIAQNNTNFLSDVIVSVCIEPRMSEHNRKYATDMLCFVLLLLKW